MPLSSSWSAATVAAAATGAAAVVGAAGAAAGGVDTAIGCIDASVNAGAVRERARAALLAIGVLL
jgi:hypothetical protein